MMDDDKPKEECAIFGIFNHEKSADFTRLALHAMQHRGQDSTGIITCDNQGNFHSHKGLDIVDNVFKHQYIIDKLSGKHAIGHNRYSTTGDKEFRNIQPLYADLHIGGIAIAHNGNLTNNRSIKSDLIERGSIMQTTTDSEVFLHLLARAQGKLEDRLLQTSKKVSGAFSLVCLTGDKLIGYRDSLGIRPLVLGEKDGCYMLASETVAFDIIGANYIRYIKPGEMIIIHEQGLQAIETLPPKKPRTCLFEYVYFARPDSYVDDINVYEARYNIGIELAKQSPVDADIIVPIPDSGTPSALGYSQESRIPFQLGIIRNQYKSRTFIEPVQEIRHLSVLMKHNANKIVLHNKRVVLIDDSIVRGTTSQKIVQLVRDAGATEVHLRIASPPVLYPCYYGIDLADEEELIARKFGHDMESFAKVLGADSIAFLSIERLYWAINKEIRNPDQPQFTDHYFTGDYPTLLEDQKNPHLHQPSLLHNISHIGS